MKSILDPLYGKLALPAMVWQVAKAPEVQRLREVRMCNINSLSLTGAGGVHRFEHSIGTTYLAQENADAGLSRLGNSDKRRLLLAALLHDVGSAGFGHSVEYMLSEDGFRHDDLLAFSAQRPQELGYEYKLAALEPVFFGHARMLAGLIGDAEMKRIADLVSGHGEFGPLISGSLDLDNIDNVYRLAYHMGVWRGGPEPLDLARAIYVNDGVLHIVDSQVDLVDDWRAVRSAMYRWLLLNEDEFSAKAMLEAALRAAHESSHRSFRWHDVDYSLMLKLAESTPEAALLAGRIMTGRLFGCLTVLETVGGSVEVPTWSDRDKLEASLNETLRQSSSKRIAKVRVALHFIQDVNKTDREVRVRTSAKRPVTFGSSINRTLIGVFARNESYAADSPELERLLTAGVDEYVRSALSSLLAKELRRVPRDSVGTQGRLDFFA